MKKPHSLISFTCAQTHAHTLAHVYVANELTNCDSPFIVIVARKQPLANSIAVIAPFETFHDYSD